MKKLSLAIATVFLGTTLGLSPLFAETTSEKEKTGKEVKKEKGVGNETAAEHAGKEVKEGKTEEHPGEEHAGKPAAEKKGEATAPKSDAETTKKDEKKAEEAK